MLYIPKPEVIVGALEKIGREDRRKLLLAYFMAGDQDPKSPSLTLCFTKIAAGYFQNETTIPGELSDEELALVILLRQGRNPFSDKDITSTISGNGTSAVLITDSHIGEEWGDQKGLFLGYFDLAGGRRKQPIFVEGLTASMTFDQTVATRSELEDGYKANPDTYDPMQALRAGHTIIAPFNIVKTALTRRMRGRFPDMFSGVRDVICCSSPPGHPNYVMAVSVVEDRIVSYPVPRADFKAPSLLVSAALT